MKQIKRSTISILVSLSLAHTATADDNDMQLAYTSTQELSGIEITALRSDKTQNSLRNIDVIDTEQLDSQQPVSVPDALKYIPNVTVFGGPRDSVQSVNIRGLGENRVLQLIDGVRQDFESGHRPTYFIDPALLKNIEVVKGPSSSLWGSGALGGVVSSNTIHAADLLDSSKTIGGFAKLGYNDNGDKWITTLAGASRFGNVDALISGYYSEQGNYELGNGDQLSGSEHEDNGLMAKFDWFINGSQTLTLNLRTSEVDGQVPSNATAEIGDSNWMINRDSSSDHASIDYRINPDNELIDSQLLLFRNNTKMDESRISDGRSDSTEIETIGLNINNRSQFGQFSLLYGIDGYQDELDATRNGDDRPIIPEATTSVWGAFAQVELPLAQNWVVNAGVRYDYFETEADNLNAKRDDDAFSPSFAVRWTALEDLSITARYDEAFRAPTAEELYSTGTHFCYSYAAGWCNTFVPNPDLEAEQAQNLELMAEYVIAGAFDKADTLRLNASIFHNDVDNFLEQTVSAPDFSYFPAFSMSGTTTVNNVDEAELEGFELSADYQLNNTRLIVSYGQTRGEDKNSGDHLANIPADKWVLDLSQTLVERKVRLGLRTTLASSQEDLPEDYINEYDNYRITDVYARFQPNKNLTLDLSINNLTDEYYRVAFEELYSAGRDVRLSAKYDF